jgi:hypothetical protein
MFAFTFSDISLASDKSCFRLGVEILRLVSKHMLNRLCLLLHLVKKVRFILFILLALDYIALSHRLFELFPFLSVIFWINIFLELFRKLSHRLFHLVLSHFELVRHLFLLTLEVVVAIFDRCYGRPRTHNVWFEVKKNAENFKRFTGNIDSWEMIAARGDVPSLGALPITFAFFFNTVICAWAINWFRLY